jgi:hypothetical protein
MRAASILAFAKLAGSPTELKIQRVAGPRNQRPEHGLRRFVVTRFHSLSTVYLMNRLELRSHDLEGLCQQPLRIAVPQILGAEECGVKGALVRSQNQRAPCQPAPPSAALTDAAADSTR